MKAKVDLYATLWTLLWTALSMARIMAPEEGSSPLCAPHHCLTAVFSPPGYYASHAEGLTLHLAHSLIPSDAPSLGNYAVMRSPSVPLQVLKMLTVG